jgi:hypothetical protein
MGSCQKTIEQLELAALTWVHWHNTERLRGYLGGLPRAEFEESFSAGARAANYGDWCHHYSHHRPYAGFVGLTSVQSFHDGTWNCG